MYVIIVLTSLRSFCIGLLYCPSGSGGGGGGGGVRGVRTPLEKLFLESGVKFTGNALYFLSKINFFLGRGGCPPTPLVMVCLM